MKKTKIINLMCLSLILFFSLIIGVNMSVKVNAETAGAGTETTETAGTTFEMVYGASIRIGEGQVNGNDMTNGLRFQVKMDETTAKSINGETKKLYVLIAPATIVDLTSDAQIEAHKSVIEGYKDKWIPVAANSIYESVAENGKNYYFANAMICNLTSDFYGVKFNAVAIIEESGEYTYAKASSATRSIYDVVNSAVLDVYADKIIGSEVAANTKLDYAKWYGTEEYPVAPKTPAQFNKYNELKSTTLKNLSVERQDVMVNNPVVTIGGKEYSIPTVPEVHGEQDVEVIVEGATVTVPVTLVTKMIGSVEDLRDITQNPTDSTTKSVFGYYKLSENLDCTAAPDWAGFSNSNPNGFSWPNANNGFRGTLDGNGKTITGFAHNQGLFFVLGNGAVIKNVDLVSTRWSGSNDRLFGIASYGATFENVNIVMRSEDGSKVPSVHLLFAEACQNNTFKNVTLKVYSDDGSTLAGLSTVFGKNFTGNTCKGVKIYCASITELGKDSSSNSVTQYDGIEIYNTEE